MPRDHSCPFSTSGTSEDPRLFRFDHRSDQDHRRVTDRQGCLGARVMRHLSSLTGAQTFLQSVRPEGVKHCRQMGRRVDRAGSEPVSLRPCQRPSRCTPPTSVGSAPLSRPAVAVPAVTAVDAPAAPAPIGAPVLIRPSAPFRTLRARPNRTGTSPSSPGRTPRRETAVPARPRGPSRAPPPPHPHAHHRCRGPPHP